LITAEADGESYVAKVAVGAVVVNRVQDSRFPNSISAVIYQKDGGYYQFSPVENGWINKPASSDSKRAALEALQGSDPTNGALYYFDDSTTNKWIWSKPIAFRTGNMVYSYY
jgi:spore germination cell wall hydrolase CwlJ-like protein